LLRAIDLATSIFHIVAGIFSIVSSILEGVFSIIHAILAEILKVIDPVFDVIEVTVMNRPLSGRGAYHL
jgi:phage-related protein